MPGLCLEDRDATGAQPGRDRERSPSASPLWESMTASPPGATRGIGIFQKVGEESAVTRLTMLSPVKLPALSSGWVGFSPPEPCRAYPELPADEAWCPSALVHVSAMPAAQKRRHVESCGLPLPSFLSSHVPCRSPQGRK